MDNEVLATAQSAFRPSLLWSWPFMPSAGQVLLHHSLSSHLHTRAHPHILTASSPHNHTTATLRHFLRRANSLHWTLVVVAQVNTFTVRLERPFAFFTVVQAHSRHCG